MVRKVVTGRLLFGALFFAVAAYCKPPCSNRVLSSVPSPDGQYRAVVFQRDCGATTSFSTQVSLIPASEEVQGSGNIFIVESGNSPADGSPAVKVTWASNDKLRVGYPARSGRIFRREGRLDGTEIAYRSF